MTSQPTADLGPEAVVGSYRLVREIGRGGMGTVYEARHVVLPRRAAIKVMHGELRRQPGMATRVVQEASILEDIRHPGVVRVYECSLLPDHRPYIAMELVEGETLASRLLHQGALAPLEVATLLAEICDVLASVHARGVIHRDLKPDNILLTPCDRDFPLRVIDWGVARLGPMGRLTLDGLTPGTPIYMSPEQAMGRNIAAPCDIYSLGVIGYELLTGHPPFDGRTLAEVVSMHLTSAPFPLTEISSAPAELADLVHRMLDKDLTMRPGAIEVRQIARGIAFELSTAYESIEVQGIADPPRLPRAARPRRQLPLAMQPTEDVLVVDPDALEFGVTEMVPTIRKPRWTPEIGMAPPPEQRGTRAPITPKAASDEIAGEIDAPKRR
ncbi:MAG TPA: serine/threonine-protein kinase [Kofleriaceae bacterium]|jgi:serine/threonine protein kinase|nr:serine/threonine-protein kinase [Kofleriaceae bacterium]